MNERTRVLLVKGRYTDGTYYMTKQFYDFAAFEMHVAPHPTKLSVNPVAQSCLTLYDPVDCSTPSLPVHHQLQELMQAHIYRGPSIEGHKKSKKPLEIENSIIYAVFSF